MPVSTIKRFLKKDSLTERRAMVCYSNYRVVDCKVCFVLFCFVLFVCLFTHLEGAERDRAALIDIGLPETVHFLLLLWWGKSQGFFFGNERKK